MASQQQQQRETIQDAVNGWGQLKARQISIHEWRVLSWRNGAITAHSVDIDELSCSCMDMQTQKANAEICDHLAAALHGASRTLDVGDAISEQMLEQMLELDEHMRALERKATGIEADAAAASTESTESTAQSESSGFDGDPVEYMKSMLRDAGIDPDAFGIRIDDSTGRLEVYKDDYIEEYNAWRELSDDLDMGYDPEGDLDINTLPADRFSEVFG
jgi:hypothetical protein